MWSLPPAVQIYILIVEATALALVAGTVTAFPVERLDLVWFAVLTVGSVVHFEATRYIERIRELASEGGPYVNLQSVWTFAGLLLLPPSLIVPLIVITYVHLWFRVTRRRVVHRYVFTAASVVLGTAAGVVVVHALAPDSYPGMPHGWTGLAAVVAAALARWLVNYVLVSFAALLSAPDTPLRRVVGNLSDYLVEAASLSLGAAVAALLVLDPPLVVVLVMPVLVVHRALLVNQFRNAARTDVKTGLLNAMFWHELAGKEIDRARRMGTTVGVLMIDLDRFKDINDRYGHLAGDKALRAVATVLKSEVRDYDLVGRFGGEEFVLLLPGITTAELRGIAERIRVRIRQLTIDTDPSGATSVSGLTVSVGAASYPDSASNLTELLTAADNALFSAKDAGRDKVCVVLPDPRDRRS